MKFGLAEIAVRSSKVNWIGAKKKPAQSAGFGINSSVPLNSGKQSGGQSVASHQGGPAKQIDATGDRDVGSDVQCLKFRLSLDLVGSCVFALCQSPRKGTASAGSGSWTWTAHAKQAVRLSCVQQVLVA